MGAFAIQSKNTDHRAPPGVRLVLGRNNLKFTERWYAFFNKNVPNIVLRLCVLCAGFFSMAMAIALSRTTGLGTSPISCLPATLSYFTPLTIGTGTFVMNCVFLLLQVILLRRDFNPVQVLQVPFVFLFSLIIDLCVPVAEAIPMPNYPAQLAWNIASCFLIAFGVFLQVKASFVTLPGEGLVLAVSNTLKKPFPKCKIAFDSTMVVISVVLSLVAMGTLNGVREGTIITALAAGAIVGLYNRIMPNFNRFCPIEGHISFVIGVSMGEDDQPAPKPAKSGEQPMVIAIERQYGSGGRMIGQAVGKKLGIPVFDHTLIDLTAKESGFPPAYVANHEQEVRRGLLYNLYMQNYQHVGAEPEKMDGVWLAQARAITKLADDGACVIVGRCAGPILRGRKNVLSVFVHAPLEARIAHVMQRENVPREEAAARIETNDRERAEHSLRFAGVAWDAPEGHHLSIDSSLEGPDDTATLIARFARRAFPKAPLSPCPEKPNVGKR